jgi:hypothetical protein
MTPNLGLRCAISVWRVLSANVREQPHRVLGEKRLSRLTPPRPAGRPRSRPPARTLIQGPLTTRLAVFEISYRHELNERVPLTLVKG